MKVYMAPLEGITSYIFRNAFAKYYGGIDRYFTPFITPHPKKGFSLSEKRDILPENNTKITVIPQILTNQVDDFVNLSREIAEFGYDEVNLNLGCPSKTVTSKKKGSGALADVEELERFLDGIFSRCEQKISIKTRIGDSDEKEWEKILEIYEKYPLSELIVHPRLRVDFYRGGIHWLAWKRAMQSEKKLVYNGDICTKDDAKSIFQFGVETLMIGRGLLKNPELISEIRGEKGKKEMNRSRFKQFHDEIYLGYAQIMSGDTPTLFKMKELWGFWITSFAGKEKYLKKIRKVQNRAEYIQIVSELLEV